MLIICTSLKMRSFSGATFAISAAIYRGAKCPTLKATEKKQPKVPVKQRKNCQKNSRNSQNSCFWVFWLFFRLCFGCFTVTHSAPFVGCFLAVFRAFGTFADGRRDCRATLGSRNRSGSPNKYLSEGCFRSSSVVNEDSIDNTMALHPVVSKM